MADQVILSILMMFCITLMIVYLFLENTWKYYVITVTELLLRGIIPNCF
jgi:hypothetical protein